MNSKERTLAALRCEQPDQVPITELSIDEPVLSTLGDMLGVTPQSSDDQLRETDLLCGIAEQLGLDWVMTWPRSGQKPISETHFEEKFGCVYQTSEHGWPVIEDGPVNGSEDLKGFSMASMLTSEDLVDLEYLVDRVGEGRLCGVYLTSPFKLSWLLRGGMIHILRDYVTSPDFVHEMARISTDYNLALIEKSAKIGVEAVVIEGDLAGEQTTLISPNHYRQFIKPYQKEIVDLAHEKGLKIVKHSDGNMWPILDDHIEIGFDGFSPIQPDCMDIAEVKAHVKGNCCLVGNIDCRHLLCEGSEEEVEEAVRGTIEIAAPGGGYIICSSNSVHPGVKAENYIAMVQAAKKYGQYQT
jgi:uroporphyrinogen decarboxylase